MFSQRRDSVTTRPTKNKIRRRPRPQDQGDGPPSQPDVPKPKANLMPVLVDDLNKEHEIDTILSQSASLASTREVGTHIDRLHPSRPLGFGMGSMSADEEASLITDVYGRKPPEAALMEERMDALEREIGRLDREERASLDKALRCHPLLTVASPHVREMLLEDDYDATTAARRLARYWRQREGVFGPRAFSSGIFTQPDFADYIRHYKRCVRAMDDPELDGEMRDMAREYVRIVNRVKIEAMDKLIEEAPEEDRAALLEARRLNPEKTRSNEHKLLFLRCEDFVEGTAAVRMMKYWAMKKSLFGSDRLGDEITLADVESSVFDSNVIGHSLLVPDTDEAGRSIFWGTVGALFGKEGWTAKGVAQYMWCILHMALARPSCRENGVVVMLNNHGLNMARINATSSVRRLCTSLVMQCMPFRVCVVHIFWSSSSLWQSFMIGVLRGLSTFANKRIVMHLGTYDENRMLLEDQFGIGPDLVVKELGGNVDMDWWRGWIMKQKEDEK